METWEIFSFKNENTSHYSAWRLWIIHFSLLFWWQKFSSFIVVISVIFFVQKRKCCHFCWNVSFLFIFFTIYFFVACIFYSCLRLSLRCFFGYLFSSSFFFLFSFYICHVFTSATRSAECSPFSCLFTLEIENNKE